MSDQVVIHLLPVEGVWLWECRVGDERCHTGSTFHDVMSAADRAGRHVSDVHGWPTPPTEEPCPC